MTAITLLYGGCALGYLVCAGIVLFHRGPGRSDAALSLACLATAVWAGVVAANPVPALGGWSAMFELFQTLGWYAFILFLYRRVMRSGPSPVRAFGPFEWLGLLSVLAVLVVSLAPPEVMASLRSLWVDVRLGLAMVTLLLIENLYRNATEDERWHIALPSIAVAGATLFGVVVYADAVLHRQFSVPLFEGRALACLLVAPLLVIGARRNQRWKEDRIVVSRSVVFQSATLIVSGVFLLGLAAAGEIFHRYGAGWGLLAEVSLIFGGLVALAVLITSKAARSSLRSLVVDHFFARRYDYEREWMRCIQTLSGEGTYIALHLRVIRAIADIVDSPGGVLFLRKVAPDGQTTLPGFEVAGAWNCPEPQVTIELNHPLLQEFGQGGWAAVADPGGPPWLPEFPKAWLAVPLNHVGVLSGLVLLSPPRAPFQLDREVFDLLRMVGREVAVFIGEQRATRALVQARQFEEAGRRFAFVAHDIKNVASQLSLLLANADQHLDNPAFRQDMMATLRGAVQKIGAMVARLQAPDEERRRVLVSPRVRLEAAAGAVHGLGDIRIAVTTDDGEGEVAMGEAALDAVIRHLLDNAIEVSPPGAAVQVKLRHSDSHAIIEVMDEGPGMSRDFVRERLFQPFTSSKHRGLGLGAFQARELSREAGGDVEVESVPGKGTTMRIILPLANGTKAAVAVVSRE